MEASRFFKILMTWLRVLQNALNPGQPENTQMQEPGPLFNFYQLHVPDPFACPGNHRPRISADGRYFALRKHNMDDYIDHVFVYKTEDLLSDPNTAGRQVTFGPLPVGRMDFIWSMDNRTVIYKERQANGSCQLMGVDAETGARRVLMADQCPVQFFAQSRFRPHQMIVGIMNPTTFVTSNPYLLDTRNGQRSLVFENKEYVLMFFDHDLNMKAAIKLPASTDITIEEMVLWKNVSNRMEVLYRMKEIIDGYYTKPYCPCFEAGKSCDMPFSAFDLSGKTIYLMSTTKWEMMSLVAVDSDTNAETVVFAPRKANVDWVFMDPRTETPAVISTRFGAQEITVLDSSLNGDIEFLKSVYPGQDFYIRQRSLDFKYWIVEYELSTHPIKYYIYDRSTRRIQFIYSTLGNLMPGLDTEKLADIYPYEMKSSDGFDQACYLTIPYEYDANKNGRPVKPMPVIIIVHPGPWMDRGVVRRYNWKEQFLANRGYGLINCNYPSSRGYGKTFADARSKVDWLKIGDDVKLMAEKAIRDGIADPNRIGVTGESNGGSWTMYSVVFNSKLFKCGDSWYGHSDWGNKKLHRHDPAEMIPEWMLHRWTVDFDDPEQVRQMRAKAPPYSVYRMNSGQSLMLSTGAAGGEMPQHTELMYEKVKERGDVNVTFLFLPDEPHGYKLPQNVNAVLHVTELFFKRCLGGRAQPLGNAIEGAVNVKVNDTGGLPQLKKTD